MLERAFANWRAPSTPLPTRAAAPIAAQSSAPRVLIVDRAGPQSIISAGRLAPVLDPSTEAAINTMNTAFGGSFTSRINMNLREDKHWSYGAGSGIRNARGPRLFITNAGVQSDKTAESLVEMQRELSGIVGGRPVTEAELAAHRANMILGMAGDWETNASVSGDLTQMVVYGLPADYYDTVAAGVAATTPDSVTAAARAVVGDGPTVWVIVGDRAQIEPRIRALNLGEVQVVDTEGRPVN